MPNWLKNTLKVTAAGATIFAIGTAVLTLEPDTPEVKDVEADILALNFGPQSTNEKFTEAIDELGLDEPRAYDWNGNKVFFSTMTTQDEPIQVLRQFQDKFVEKGINKKRWTRSLPKSEAAANPQDWKHLPKGEREEAAAMLEQRFDRVSEFMSGGIVPTQISEDYVSMTGMESKGDAEHGLEFLNEVLGAGGFTEASKQVKSMRWVEAIREGSRTRVSAVWSDDELDMSKFEESRHASRVSASTTVPVCMGCERKMRFAGESEGEERYASNVFVGDLSVEDAISFYKRAMPNRGWKLSDTSHLLEIARAQQIKPPSDARLLSFSNERDFITLLVHPRHDGKTVVQAFESP